MAQAVPAAQAFPQVPQWAGLLAVSTQVPPQSVWPVGQPQAPPIQTLPPMQTVPQVPQLLPSDCVSTQEPLHGESGAAQPAAHWPREQT
jgi:hypothetical protein